MSHEQVPTVVILRLETGKSTIPGVVGCRRVVPHSCENKAISAPSWAWAWAELGNSKVMVNLPHPTNIDRLDHQIVERGGLIRRCHLDDWCRVTRMISSWHVMIF